MPVFASVVGWAAASFIITGQPFGQFTSQYGTSAQIAAGGGIGQRFPLPQEIRLEAHALFYLAPLLVLILVVALILAVRRRNALLLAPLSLVGGGLLFDLVGYLDNSIIWSFRYLIATVLLEALVMGVVVANFGRKAGTDRSRIGRAGSLRESGDGRFPRNRPWRSIGLAGFALLCLGPSVPNTAAGMFAPVIGFEELEELGYVFHHPLSAQDRINKAHYPTILNIAGYIASLHLPVGDVLTDNSVGCIPEVIVNVPNPKVFVIPNDRDFQRTLADALTWHAHYILASPNSWLGVNSAISKAYPSLYATGSGFSTLVKTLNPTGDGLCPSLRLYRVTGHPSTLG